MRDPRSTSPGSIMPAYGWLLAQRYDTVDIVASLRALRKVGLPYTDAQIGGAPATIRAQADEIVAQLAQGGITTEPDREIVALIAYLQRLGRDGKAAIAAPSGPPTVSRTTP
jgi:cytochrome c oxidase cbb3-type subunit I/II